MEVVETSTSTKGADIRLVIHREPSKEEKEYNLRINSRIPKDTIKQQERFNLEIESEDLSDKQRQKRTFQWRGYCTTV